jgi:hypothetical protein
MLFLGELNLIINSIRWTIIKSLSIQTNLYFIRLRALRFLRNRTMRTQIIFLFSRSFNPWLVDRFDLMISIDERVTLRIDLEEGRDSVPGVLVLIHMLVASSPVTRLYLSPLTVQSILRQFNRFLILHHFVWKTRLRLSWKTVGISVFEVLSWL